MDIGFDARISFYNSSGISCYIRGLLGALSGIESENRFVIYQSWRASRPLATGPSILNRKLVTPSHFKGESRTLPLELKCSGLSLLQSLDFYSPTPIDLPLVTTIYDLYFLRDPSCMDAQSFAHYEKIRHYSRAAIGNICISDATRKEAIEQLGLSPEKTCVIYPGFSPSTPPDISQMQVILKSLGISTPFLLFVGTIEPRKNIERLIFAYSLSRKKFGARIPPLVMVGRAGCRASSALEQIKKLNLERSVYYLGERNSQEVDCLYAGCKAVVYPSLWEGFGFPLLEAFAFGKPIITSNLSALPEVGGNAPCYVNPYDVESISAGIETVVLDNDLASELVKRGANRLKLFSWEKAAFETLEAHRQFLLGSVPDWIKARAYA